MNDNKINSTNATESQETVYERLVLEREELDMKIRKLEAFLSDEKVIPCINYIDLVLLKDQLISMKKYWAVLNERILRWEK